VASRATKLFGLVFLAASAAIAIDEFRAERPVSVPPAVFGDAAKVERAYAEWREQLEAGGRADTVVLPLSWSRGRSCEHTGATGVARIDLADQRVDVEVEGFEPGSELDAWFVGEPRGAVRLGRLDERSSGWYLERSIARFVGRFELDLVAVTQAGAEPSRGGLLFGTPDLFQRL
jgi:hypothetical protein